jgi:MFS family permease
VTVRAVLRAPGVSRLAVAGLLSEVGDWMLLVSLPLFVLQLSGSALVTATVFALELVPTVVLGPLAGVLVDRLDPWRLMAGVVAAQAALLLPLLLVDSADDLWIVYAVVAAESVLGTVVEPGRAATAAALVGAEDLMAVNGAMGVLSGVARLVGGPVGGLVLGLWGIDGVVIADAGTFVAAGVLFLVRRTPVARSPSPRVRLLHDWVEGIAVVRRSPVLRRVMGVMTFMALAQGGFVVLFVLFVVRELGGSEADVGVLRGVQAIGAIAGGALLGPLVRRCTAERMVAIALAAFGALSLVTWNAPALTTAFGLYVGLFIAVGAPGIAAMTGLLTLLQTHAPPDARGRVLSAFLACSGGVQAAGMLVAGLVGSGAGLSIALQVQGMLYLAAAALALRLRR